VVEGRRVGDGRHRRRQPTPPRPATGRPPLERSLLRSRRTAPLPRLRLPALPSMRRLSRPPLSPPLPLLLAIRRLPPALISLLRITAALDDLERAELGALRREGELHRAAWTLDVSMRHAEDDCREGRAPPMRNRIDANVRNVDAVLAATEDVSPPMQEVIE